MGKAIVTAIAAALLLAGGPLWAANLLTNGDFEDTTGWGDPGTTENPVGWPSSSGRLNPAAEQSGANAIGGAGASAYMPAFKTSTNRRDFLQAFDGPSAFVIEFDLASEDPGADADRSYNSSFMVADSVGALGINLRVVDVGNDGVGDLQVQLGTAAKPLPGLVGSITFDDNVETIPLVNHVKCIGRYDGANAYYDLVVTNASGQVFTETGLQYYTSTTRILEPGAELQSITFSTFMSLGDYLLDNVSVVPEPSTIAMLLLGGLCALAIKLRRR